MRKRIIALILALVMVFDMGAVALANGTGADLPAEDEPKQEETVTEEQQEDPAAEEQQEEPVTEEQIEESHEEVTLVSIEVTTLPDKVEYLCTDTAVDPAGGILTLTYSDGSTEAVELSCASLSALSGNACEVSVTVSYEGMTDSFAVTVSHSYDDGVVTTEPTATEAGVMTYTCGNCGDEQTSEIPMAVSEEISGTCGAQGNNLTWTFSDGVLTISGSGAMAHYTSADDESRPWIPYLKDIRKIVVGSNVDEIDNYAFAGCTNAESITVPFIGGGAESNMFLGYVFGAPPAQGIVGEYNPDYVPGSLKSVTVTNADAIGIGSFHGCSSLESVDISGNVSAVGDYAFYGCSALKTVSIPDSATSIGNSAFYECASLTGFTIPDDVTVIGESAFSGCRGLEAINIPEGVKEIKDYAFNGLVKVKNISIPDSVTAIGSWAFGECYSLEEVNIPTGITAINDGTFISCMALKSVVIPENITSIGRDAFFGCSSLGEITFEGDAPTIAENAFENVAAMAYYYASKNWTEDDFQDYGGTLTWEAMVETVAGGTCGAQDDNLTWTLDSDGVLTVNGEGDMADYTGTNLAPWYDYRKSINSITIGAGAANIGEFAFDGCTGIKSVDIAEGVTEIGKGAFHECLALENITIPSSVKSIGDYCFYECDNIKSVCLPDDVTYIGCWAFYGCNNLASINIPDGLTSIEGFVFCGCSSIKNISIPEGVKSIGDYAFYRTSLRSISIPDGMVSIGEHAFRALYSIAIPASVTSISPWAFEGCNFVTAGPAGGGYDYEFEWTEAIPAYALHCCDDLVSAVIPEGVTSIGGMAFAFCGSLTEITFEGDAPIIAENVFDEVTATAYYNKSKNWTSDDFQNYGGTITWKAISRGTCGANGSNLTWDLSDGVLTISGKGKMADYSSSVHAPWYEYKDDIKGILIDTGVTGVGAWAFWGCSAVANVTIADTVTEIAARAFSDCSGLTSITIPDSVTDIGSSAFSSCSSLQSLTIPFVGGTAATDTYIGHIFGASSYLKNANYVPASLKKITVTDAEAIPDYAFYGCSGLTEIDIPESTASIGIRAFYGCQAIKEIDVPSNVASIGDYAFADCIALNNVSVPSGVSTIEDYVFSGCKSLSDITLPNSITGIGLNAFSDCISLENISLPTGIIVIGDQAFSGCSILKDINIPDGVTSIGVDVFSYCSALENIELPANVSSIGKRAFSDCAALTGIIIPDKVTDIGEEAFYNCSSITEIIIPGDVANIGNYAFYDCEALSQITFQGDAPSIGDKAFTGVTATAYYDAAKNWTSDDFQNYGGTITWKPIVEIIASGICGAQGDNLTWTLDSEGVLTISGEGAMKNYSNNYGDANYAPWHGYTKDIKKIFIEDGATAIGEFAFCGCYAFSDITIPESVKRIEGGAFDGCNALEKITLPDGLEHLGDAAFLSCVKLVDVNIPSGLNEIGEATFCGCRSLAKIVIPDNIAAIGDLAFADCSALSMVNIPESVKTIGNVAFSGCSALKKLTLHKDVSIGHAVFAECGFETAGPIGSGSDIEFGWRESIPEYAFQGCAALKSIIIPDDVTVIGEGAFKACTSLTDITIPSGVNAIQDQTFHSCGALADVIIPNNVSSIGKQAFLDCASLSIVTIPEKVDSISDSAFWGCLGLKEINFQGDAPIMGEYTFNEVTATAYYFADKDWTQDDLQDYSGHITWVARLSPDYKAIISGKDSMKSGEKLNLVAILSPRNVTDTTIEWRLAEGDEVAASITGKWDEDTDTATATVTALPVSEINEITVIAYTADGLAVSGEHRITVIPAPTAVTIKDEAGNEVTGGTVGVNVNETKELIFAASIFPEGAEGAIEWTSSDTKGAYGSYTDNGDGTVTAIIEDGIRSGSITLTATEKGSGAKATVKLSITSVTTDLELGADNEGIAGEPSLGEITAEEKAAALVGGQSRVLSVILHGEPSKANVIWSIPAEYAPFASIKAGSVKNGIAIATVKASAVSAPVQIKVVAEASDNLEAKAEMWLWIVPATTGVAIEDADGNGVTGTTVLFDLNGEADNIVFTAATTPADSKDGVTWTSSDKTGAMGSIAVGDDGNLIFTPADTVAAGKTITFTATAADGSKKSAKVTVKFAKLADEINIINAIENLAGGKYVTLKTDVQADKTLTDKTVEWKLREQDYEYASITSAGKLTAKAFAGEPVEIQVTAIVKATGAESDPVTITLNPNLTSSLSIMLNGKNVNGTTQKVDVRDGQIELTAKAVGLEGQDIVWGPTKASGAAYFADPASGVLTLNKEGAVTITAAAGKTKATFKLTAATPVEQLAIDGNDVMTGGTKQTLTVNFTDAEGNGMQPTNSKVDWKIIEGAAYAAVKNGTLTAGKVTAEHTVTVVATAQDNGAESAPFTVTIKPATNNIKLYVLDGDEREWSLTNRTETIDVGDEAQRTIHLMAKGYPYYEGQTAVTWKSSTPAAATVDENGVVEVQWDAKKGCYKTGKVTITATAADGSKKSAKVTLNLVQLMDSIELPETMGIAGGKHIKFRTMIDERATKKDIVWSMTGDTEWAKLNNGKLITKKVTSPKTVTVTATAADGGGAKASCVVTIYPAVTAVSIFSGGTNVTGSTVDFDDGMTFTLKNSPNSAYKSWTAKSSNAGILASIEGDALTITRNPEKTLKANTKVTITVTAADGSGKSAKVTAVVK